MHRIASYLTLMLLATTSCTGEGTQDGAHIPISLVEIERGQATVHIETPSRGTQTDQEEIEVSGQVDDVDFLSNLIINENIVEVAQDGSFATMVPLADGLNTLDVLAIHSDESSSNDKRTVLKGDFLPPFHGVEDAAITTIGNNVLKKLEKTIANEIVNTDIMDFVENDLIYGRGGCSTSAWLRGATIDASNIEFLPSNDQMMINAEITDVRIDIRARAAKDTFLGCFRTTKNGTVSIPTITVRGRMIADNRDINGRGANIIIPNLDIRVPTVGYNLRRVPNWLEDLIIGNIQPVVENAFNQSFSSSIPSMIQRELSNLIQISLPNIVPGTSVLTHLNTSAIHFDESGIEVKTDINFTPEFSFDEIENVIFAPLPIEPTLENKPKNSDVDLSISLDIINQFLTNLWIKGVFNFQIDQETLNAIEQVVPIGLKDFTITSSLPPRVELKDGLLVLTNADLIVGARLEGDIFLEAATTTVIKLGIEITENNGFKIVKGDQDTFATVLNGDESGLTEGLLSTILDLSANFFIEQVNNLIEEVKIPGNANLADVLEITASNQRLEIKGNL